MAFQAPRGTNDVLPSQSARWAFLESSWFAHLHRYGYREVRTPMFEDLELFLRTSGETSDVVSKEMYDFEDKGGRKIALKPEGTAPIMRMMIEHGLLPQGAPNRFAYFTQIFRYGRPGKGRFRQAHQLGMELIGSPSPLADAEVIEATYHFFQSLGIKGVRVKLNSIGRTECRANYRQAILDHMAAYLAEQSAEEQEKARKNPMRLLDTKDPAVKAALQGVPSILEFLEPECAERFEQLKAALDAASVPYEVDPAIVRGLDYYTETVFEMLADGLDDLSLCGGGRYDNLVKEIGGPPTPSVGMAMGIERLLLALEASSVAVPEPVLEVFVASDGDRSSEVVALASRLRASGVSAAYDLEQRKLSNQLKLASRLGAQKAILLRDGELPVLRDLSTGEQTSGEIENLLKELVP